MIGYWRTETVVSAARKHIDKVAMSLNESAMADAATPFGIKSRRRPEVTGMKNLKCMAFFLFASVACTQQPTGKVELVVNYRGVGGLVASTVAPGTTAGSERLYASYLYMGKSFDVLSIDSDTGDTEVFHSPIAGEIGARSMTVGPDGNVYLGTLPNAHFLELDTKQRKLIDLGRPSATETYIWDVTFGSDNRLYGVTFPGCKLVRYDPHTGQLSDLGRLDPTEQYAHFIVGSGDEFLYIGIGYGKANIAAYNVRTGEHREILAPDAQTVGVATVYRGQDGDSYGIAGKRYFRLNKWTVTELAPGQTVPRTSGSTLRDGRYLALSDNKGSLMLTITDPNTHAKVERQIHYQGQELQVFRIGFGTNGVLYGSSVIPMHLFSIDLSNQHVKEIGEIGDGEVYSFLSHGPRLLMAAYAGLAPLMSYAPEVPFQLAGSSGNPTLVNFPGADPAWRAEAMIDGPNGIVYVGALAGYGKIEAPLTEWNVESGVVQLDTDIVKDQSVISLARWHDLVVGGTSTEGGGGSHPTQKEARLFVWNPKTHRKEFEIVPVTGQKSVTDLITAPNDRVYGIAGDTLFAFNPQTYEITSRQKLPFSGPIYNSVAMGKDGRIWGLAPDGIFAIDTRTNDVKLIVHAPQKITGGFGLHDGAIYFISGSAVYRYKM